MGTMTTEPQDIALRKEAFDKAVSYGEPQTTDEWEVIFSVNEDLRYLAQSLQIPEVTRERIEDFCVLGVQMGWPGRPKNLVEMTCSFKEVKKGVLYNTLENLVMEKTMFDLEIRLLPNGQSRQYQNCFIETVEGLDLEYEGNTIAKPSVTIVCNWPHPYNASN